jgi:hypothetical protein
VEGFGRLKSVGRYSIWWRLVKKADEAMGLWEGENEVGGNCGGGRVEAERVFGWRSLAEMLEGTRSPFFPPSCHIC